MTDTTLPRVNFFEKQFLRVDEFRDEQLYQLAARRRHNIAQHSWGIVAGLELMQDEDGTLVVRPGLAIDGYGRELILPEKKRLAAGTFNDLGTEKLDIWLAYSRQEGEAAPDGYTSCGKNGGREAYRSKETPEVRPERPLSNIVDARRPPGVPAAVLDSKVPLISDNPADTWKVYLGRITRLENSFTIDISQRPYAGLVGEVVDHPADATRVEIGKQSSTKDSRRIGNITYVYKKGEEPQSNQSRRFAVFMPEHTNAATEQQQVELSPRLEIMRDAIMRLRGRTIINGSLRIVDGAVQFVDPAAFTTENAPQEPSIYRIREGTTDQLRVDLGASNTPNREFVIGFSTDDGTFTPCLKLELKDTTGSGKLAPLVTIFGDLKVEGKLIGAVVQRTLSQEAMSAILSSFQSGVSASNP